MRSKALLTANFFMPLALLFVFLYVGYYDCEKFTNAIDFKTPSGTWITISVIATVLVELLGWISYLAKKAITNLFCGAAMAVSAISVMFITSFLYGAMHIPYEMFVFAVVYIIAYFEQRWLDKKLDREWLLYSF